MDVREQEGAGTLFVCLFVFVYLIVLLHLFTLFVCLFVLIHAVLLLCACVCISLFVCFVCLFEFKNFPGINYWVFLFLHVKFILCVYLMRIFGLFQTPSLLPAELFSQPKGSKNLLVVALYFHRIVDFNGVDCVYQICLCLFGKSVLLVFIKQTHK